MRRSAAVAVLILIVIMMVVRAVDHDAVVPMPVSLADADLDAADSDPDFFRDDDRFIAAGVHRTGKCRHCQERNKTKDKHGILHGTLFGWGRSVSRCPIQCALDTSQVCIGLTNTVLDTSSNELGPADAHQIKVEVSPDSMRRMRRTR
jgi:hypothetical protein